MDRWPRRCVLVCCVAMALCGCSSFKQPARNMHYYFLEYPPPDTAGTVGLPHVLRVKRFRSARELDSKKMIYREHPFQRNAYVYHRWWGTPGEMATSLISRDLAGSGLFKAVVAGDDALDSTHVLDGMVEAFYEKDSKQTCEAVLALRVLLVKENEPDIGKRVLLNRRFQERIPCTERTPAALAEAMSKAMETVSGELAMALAKSMEP